MKILLVEDDPLTRTLLERTLINHNYHVDVAKDGQSGLELAQTYTYDLLLLDVVLPLINGISLCQKLRSQGLEEPIILLTAKDSSNDQIIGLDAGADDYIIKPVDLETLLARIRALLRRKNATLSSVIHWENLELNTNNCEVSCQGEPIHLTAKEYGLLELFLVNPKRIFSRRVILERLWDIGESPGEETVSTHIKCLRQKLKAAAVADPIETVYGLGYRLKKASDQETPQPKKLTKKQGKDVAEKEENVLELTSKVWSKFKEGYSQQVAEVEEYVKGVVEGKSTIELREKASKQAHKLAGSLGIFGLFNGSKLARELEEILEGNTGIKAESSKKIQKLITQLRQEIEQASIPPVADSSVSRETPFILIIDDDLGLAERIRLEAKSWQLHLEIATDLTIARQMIIQKPPAIVLLDLNFESATEDGFTLLEELGKSMPNLPVIIFTGRDNLSTRLKVARLGAKAFLHKVLPVHEILKTVTDVLNQNYLSFKNRVMIVDDDTSTLSHIVELLKPLNIEVTPVNNPHQFWEKLTETHPNLLILDVEIPEINGLELCQVVRHDPSWKNLPIIFFSIHTEESMIQQMFTAGADDYVSKASDKKNLINHIVRRLKLKVESN